MILLTNEFVEVGLDEKTGALVHLLNRKTGYQAIHQPALALGLTMRIPVGQHRSHSAPSAMQQISDCQLKENGVVITYANIVGQDTGKLDISAQVDITLNGPDISFSVSIDNRTEYTIEEVAYPCLGGFKEPEGEGPFHARTPNMGANLTDMTLDDGFANPDYWGTDWPTVYKTYPDPDVSGPFLLLCGDTQGIYVGMHCYEPKLVSFVHEYKPGFSNSKDSRLLKDNEIPGVPAGFCLSVTRAPFIAPGEKMDLAPIVVSMFQGDWHQGVQPYIRWRKTWFKPVKRPSWLDDADCWMTLHINSPEGCKRYTYKELPDVMREAKKGGVKVLQLIGWARGGQDGDEPYQDTDPMLGTREELKQAIREIRDMGIRVLMMCKFKWADQSTDDFKKELMPYTMKDMFGSPVQFGGYAYQTLMQHVNGGSRRSGFGLCHLSKDYRAIALREFRKILDLEPDGILYDELGNPMLCCFDASHGHRPGECHHIGSLELAKEFYEEASKHNEDFFMAGEGPNDAMCQYYLGNYIRTFEGSVPHAPVWKFFNPDLYVATCLVGFDDREMVNLALTYGYAINYEPYNFKGRVNDVPLTRDYILQALALRKELKDYIWTGTFRHTEGAVVKNEGAPSCKFIYSLFINRKTGKQAVVVANQDAGNELVASVALVDGGKLSKAYYIGEDEPRQADGHIRLAPRSCCVLVEE
ncbi:MAG TPA: hypothetical protein IAA58_11595 [Candidatus Gallacutalibacter stercoravium]|nr:hypothetical protein [Candidatus Gallacutalibacter stercoravium]